MEKAGLKEELEDEIRWEKRPGGMLVQKRDEDFSRHGNCSLPPNCRIKVAYGALRYEFYINPQSTFGELKKLVSAETGLQPVEQKLIFRGKERENGSYLDACGVKNKSKIVLMEDPSNREKRYIEMRKNAKIQSANRAINNVSNEVNKLAEQVTAIEKSISAGKKVAEVQITTLTEMLMRQAVKLDTIPAAGDATAQKKIEAKRVQKCVETLDLLKVSNARVKANIVATTKWETFEPSPALNSHWEYFD